MTGKVCCSGRIDINTDASALVDDLSTRSCIVGMSSSLRESEIVSVAIVQNVSQ